MGEAKESARVAWAKSETIISAVRLANDIEREGGTVIGIIPEVRSGPAIASSVNHQLSGAYLVIYRMP